MDRLENGKIWLGLDIGSVSVKGAAINGANQIITSFYKRSHGQPVAATVSVIKDLMAAINGHGVERLGVTGTAGELIASLTGGVFTNEVIAQSSAVSVLYPHVRTLVEMGGEDSKMLMFKEEAGETTLEDFSMNNLCAAGTGSFLDQQASRMGYAIAEEFGAMALKSKHPPRIAGRCSVFAKSDMIHLQQVGTPDYEIIAGLCCAVARSFKSNVGRGKEFKKPVAFFGGVAANRGVVKALADELEMSVEEIFIPEEHAVTGAIGAALASRDTQGDFEFKGTAGLEGYQAARDGARKAMAPLTGERNDSDYDIHIRKLGENERDVPCYIGIDIGSLSTNVIALDDDLNVLARRYIRTQSRPIQAVTRGLLEIGEEIGGKVNVLGVGTTGSGRYMIGDFAGADVVRNEITAQATAAIHFHPDVDTIFEIGGQDSKYVAVEKGAVVDFEMNKVCAAGTGSFIEEQAEKLDLNIEKEFASTAFAAKAPGKLGDRCTVFIESDLVSNQQKGMAKEDLAAGLAYSIVSNYLNRVVGDRKIGNKILFQGGVAWNRAVVSAFEAVTGKSVTVPPHHDVTGAIGAAMIAMKHRAKTPSPAPSRFKGFDLRERKYKVTSFECKACDNVCNVSRVRFEGESAHHYGARCELFEGDKKKKKENTLPDLFAEREKLAFKDHLGRKHVEKKPGMPLVGIPRSLYFYEHYPFWGAFFANLGIDTILSGKTNQNVIHESVERVKAETCFPIKIMHGHVAELLDKGVDYVFIPSTITVNPKNTKFTNSHTCPLVQAIPYIIKSAIDLKGSGAALLEPAVHFQRGMDYVANELIPLFSGKFGVSAKDVRMAVQAGHAAQEEFYAVARRRGREVMAELGAKGEKPVVIISRPYNGCDSGINLDLPRKLRDMGKVAVPIDFLELSEEQIAATNPDMYWRSGQRMMAAADIVRRDPMMDAIFISNFKCGPDSFIQYHVKEKLGGKPCLALEIDEHSADAGAVTRLEAFFDSLENVDAVKFALDGAHAHAGGNGNGHKKEATMECGAPAMKSNGSGNGHKRKLYMPYMCDHSHVIAAAMRASGVDAEALPETDQESLELGLRHSSGKECVPFTLTTGDILKKTMEEDFDHKRAAFFMPTTQGPCRFGQYKNVQSLLLRDMGMGDIPIVSPDSDAGYGAIGELGVKFRRAAWRGVVAVDILHKLLHEIRPYEKNRGQTEKVYREMLDKACALVEKDSSLLFDFMNEVNSRFASIPKSGAKRPVIGIVGEIYMRSHTFGNRDIIRRIEALGGEVWLAPMGEWILYCTNRYVENSKKDKKYLDLLKGYMQDRIQKKDERRLYGPFHATLSNGEEEATAHILGNAAPYMDATFEGEAILSIGKAVEYAKRGLAGVVNILPFSCMPGTIVAAISKKMREDHNNIPWLNLDFDGTEETGTQTRLEAFMYQAEQYRQQTSGALV
ncbi:MAG: CoA activase [Nitrospinae bacterium]|nr:CoA activase [Nitrospinota bacterium]